MTSGRIAVTGVGIISALGMDARTTFERVARGDRGFVPVSLFDPAGLRSNVAAQVPSGAWLSAGASGAGSRTDLLALTAAREAMNQAGLLPRRQRVAVVFGGTAGAMLECEADLLQAGPTGSDARRAGRLVRQPLSHTTRMLESEVGSVVGAATLCSACSSGAAAIAIGAQWILTERAEAVLAGGADALCRMTMAGFDALGALSPEPCRPFDAARKGLSLGEGAAFLVLEGERRAIQRGAPILAWLSGWAVGAEAHHSTQPEASGRRASALIRASLAQAGLSGSAIDYINAHGTATRQNDVMEAAALHAALGSEASRIPVSSTKGQLGHTLGAAGALEAALTVLALGASVVPPTAGLLEPEDQRLNHVIGEGRSGRIRAALSNSFGFGGMDAVLLFAEARASTRVPRRPLGDVVITGHARAHEEGRSALELLDPARSRRFDSLTAELTLAVETAVQHARLDPTAAGLVVGNAYGNVERSLRFLDRLLFQGVRLAPPAEFPHLLHSGAAGHSSIYLRMDGPVFSVCESDGGAECAIAAADSFVRLGLASAIVAGAIETHDRVVAGVASVPIGQTRARGGGFVVLESRAAAAARGANPICSLIAHFEERGEPGNDLELVGPRDIARARVVVSALNDALRSRLAQSAWAAVSVDTPITGDWHEAIGGWLWSSALELFSTHDIDEVLIVSGGESRRFWTVLRREVRVT